MKKTTDSQVTKLKKQFAQRFTKIRAESGLSQQDMADTIGMSQNLVYRSEKDCDISLSSFLLLHVHYVKNYNMNPDWFFAEDNQGLAPYELGPKRTKRLVQSAERKRAKIIGDMIAELDRQGLLPAGSGWPVEESYAEKPANE